MQNIYGACYHPVYGGWVSLDGVFIFKDVLCPDLPQQAPQDVFPNREERIELLKKYNTPPWSFRDLLSVSRKYAEEHENYLSSNLDQKIAIAKRIGRWEDGMQYWRWIFQIFQDPQKVAPIKQTEIKQYQTFT